ncbi:hypothetical protein ACTJKN_05190 [Pedobacter sp. 22163]|uniref:hypothetical protein n=1 Tax=Pedobacter sp. 22163 TaxID=3453883 RepID=UPI003F844641
MARNNRPGIRSSFVQPEDLLDRIYKAWLAHAIDKLPEVEQKVLERMEYADRKLTKGGVGSMYFNLLDDMEQYFKEHGVSRRTLENDISRAKKFFLSARPREDKEYARGKSIQWLERLIWKAEEECDFRAAALLMKELDEIQGFKREDPNLPDYEKFEIQPILVISDPTQLGVPQIENLEEELAKLRGSRAQFLSQLDMEDAQLEEEEDSDGSI